MSDSIEGLKQRLVGAFVILTLAIIFLPMIFDKPHVIGHSKIVPIPPKPEFQTLTITKPDKPQFEVVEIEPDSKQSEQASAPVPAAEPVQKAANTQNPAKKAAVEKSAPTSKTAVSHMDAFKDVWMVQLGTFSNTENAYRLRDRLRNDGFDGHTREVLIKGKKSVRVFSGPFVNKREAEKTKRKLDAKYKVKSLVLFFDA